VEQRRGVAGATQAEAALQVEGEKGASDVPASEQGRDSGRRSSGWGWGWGWWSRGDVDEPLLGDDELGQDIARAGDGHA